MVAIVTSLPPNSSIVTCCCLPITQRRDPMGITGLWDVLGEGEVVELAKLSTDHFQKHRRPLRIAVDEAGWRFHNLTAQQVFAIRQREPAANPIEKAILYRIVKLLRLNIQPLFIFDGPKRPWKRGQRGGGRIDYDKTRLLIQLLDALKLPHHRAPAEAEAECARLQSQGIVDAVWSDDGDTLMFGATMLIREVRSGSGETRKSGKKSDSLVRVYQANVIQQQIQIDKAGLLLFVLLAGGDYDMQGLMNCGAKTSLKAVQWQGGRLSNVLMSAASTEGKLQKFKLEEFRATLRDFLFEERVSIQVPADFPKVLALKNYHQPVVSSPEQLHNLRSLRQGWDRTFDESKLFPFLQSKFNFWSKEYTKHIIPIILTQRLRRIALGEVDDEFVRKIQLAPRRTKAELDKPITFLPAAITTLDLSRETSDGSLFATMEPAESNMLLCLLEPVLGEAALNTATATKARKKPTPSAKNSATSSQTLQRDMLDIAPAKRPRDASPSTKHKKFETEIDSQRARKSRKISTPTNSQDQKIEQRSDAPSSSQVKSILRAAPSFRLPLLNDELARLLEKPDSSAKPIPAAEVAAVHDLYEEDEPLLLSSPPVIGSDIREARLPHFETRQPVWKEISNAPHTSTPLSTKSRTMVVIDLTDD
ncbi:PIN domain-like protein, protein [Acrodontium crateriforme]|uniref:PIN domain-like protein, protein n=1 Tax=Acrodontium crateriforme TaxID=150365 RepID=A0AAQ3R6Y1_9PEZI|nr:PIN domain-like protein, protein [Acrodontium crateriforme]